MIAVGPGKAQITVSTTNGKTYSREVVVNEKSNIVGNTLTNNDDNYSSNEEFDYFNTIFGVTYLAVIGGIVYLVYRLYNKHKAKK